LSQIAESNIYLTCELSLYPAQKPSAEGIRFELLSLGAFDQDTCRALFSAIGPLSMDATLGDGHTIDVSSLMRSGQPSVIGLTLFSRTRIGYQDFGVYQVAPAAKSIDA
jgi:hypothetical protein